MLWYSGGQICFGLDIGFDFLRVVEVSRTKGGCRLEKVGQLKRTRAWDETVESMARYVDKGQPELPHLGARGPHQDIDARHTYYSILAQDIERLIKNTDISALNVVSSFPASSVIARFFSFEGIQKDVLSMRLRQEIAELTSPNNSITWDYFVFEALPESSRVEGVYIVAPKQLVEDRIAVCRWARLQPWVVDVDSVAVTNAYQELGKVSNEVPTVLLDLREHSSSIVVFDQGSSCYIRSVMFSIRNVIHALSVKTDQSASSIEHLLKKGEVDFDHDLKRGIFARFIRDIETSFSYFTKKDFGAEDISLVITGEVSYYEIYQEVLSEYFQRPVEVWNPLKHIDRDSEKYTDEFVESHGRAFSVACGLALRNG